MNLNSLLVLIKGTQQLNGMNMELSFFTNCRVGRNYGIWFSKDLVTWMRNSSLNWGGPQPIQGFSGGEAYRYVAFNAGSMTTNVEDNAVVGEATFTDSRLNFVAVQPNMLLTFASNKNLTGDPSFAEGDPVQQDSGYTPTTSVITGVTSNSLTADTWSNYLTQTGAQGGTLDAPAAAFNGGNIQSYNRAYNGNSSSNPNSMTWTPPSALVTDFIWVQGGDGGATIDGLSFKVNGTTVSPLEQQMQAGQTQGWSTYHKLPVNNGSLTSVEIINNKTSGVLLFGFSLDQTPYTESSSVIPGAIKNGEAINLGTAHPKDDTTSKTSARVTLLQ